MLYNSKTNWLGPKFGCICGLNSCLKFSFRSILYKKHLFSLHGFSIVRIHETFICPYSKKPCLPWKILCCMPAYTRFWILSLHLEEPFGKFIFANFGIFQIGNFFFFVLKKLIIFCWCHKWRTPNLSDWMNPVTQDPEIMIQVIEYKTKSCSVS